MIFKWLANSRKPAQSDAASDFLLSLTGSPAAVLQQVFDWVEDQLHGGQADLNLIRQADSRLEPVLAEIVASLAVNRRLGVGHKLLRSYCENFARAYVQMAQMLADEPGERLVALLRASHLYSRACRLARMTYGDPGGLRQQLLAVYQEAQRARMATELKSPYTGVAATSVAQELAVAMLWETVPFETLSLEQIDYLERFIAFHGSQIVVRPMRDDATPYTVLQDGRVLLLAPGDAADADAVLFIGPGLLIGLLTNIAKLSDTTPVPAWAEPVILLTDIRTIKSLALRMVATWENRRIPRGNERKQRHDTVRVAGGFNSFRRAVAYSAYLRNGGRLNAYDTTKRIFTEEMREILVGVDEAEKPLTPIQVLLAMEEAGGSQAVESWSVGDSSPHGYSLLVPGFRNWLAVGGLLAVRENDQIDWRIAFVRRLYGPANARRVGVELFSGQAFPVGMGKAGEFENLSIVDLQDAVLIGGDAESWLVTPSDCIPGGCHLIVGQDGRQKYMITMLSYATSDYRVYVCKKSD